MGSDRNPSVQNTCQSSHVWLSQGAISGVVACTNRLYALPRFCSGKAPIQDPDQSQSRRVAASGNAAPACSPWIPRGSACLLLQFRQFLAPFPNRNKIEACRDKTETGRDKQVATKQELREADLIRGLKAGDLICGDRAADQIGNREYRLG